MSTMQPVSLTARIANCIQTILELEPMLRRLDLGHVLLADFKVLEEFLHDVNSIDLDELEVSRIETATERFLQELKAPMSFSRPDNSKHIPLQ